MTNCYFTENAGEEFPAFFTKVAQKSFANFLGASLMEFLF